MTTKKKGEYGRIFVLREKLHEAGIPQAIIAQILEGQDTILQSTAPEKKAAWMKGAMHRMDQLLDQETRQAVREGCACCLGGKRQEMVKAIAKQYETLEDRIKAANEAKLVFGHSVALQPDGRVQVRFAPEGLEHYRCPCLSKAQEPLSITYCYCCGGHVKHHLQIALGRKLAVEVRSSALSSGWKEPCTFLFSFAD